MAQGANALMASAAGTRIALLRSEPWRLPTTGKAALAHAAYLLRVQRQVVAEHAGRFPGRNFGQGGNVIQHAGDVVEQGEGW